MQTMLASNINNVVSELYAVLLHSNLVDVADQPEDTARDAAWSMTLGKQGHRPPWPRSAGEAAGWEIRQIEKLLRRAEALVISPTAHAAVMAAAATLESADVSTPSPAWPLSRPPRPSSPNSSANTGRSRTCTMSAAPPSPRTPPSCGLATPPRAGHLTQPRQSESCARPE
ncbi:hypothetical protein ACIP39_12060 [Streptomyces tibetensis]|uniref:hypothetical protein n=1 Tax=Streptomyces tibetensis TaxID=2382123 RepID=UPI0037FE2EC7